MTLIWGFCILAISYGYCNNKKKHVKCAFSTSLHQHGFRKSKPFWAKMRNYNTTLRDNNTLRESLSKRICEYQDLGNDNRTSQFLFDWMIAWPFKALSLVKWFSVNCLLLLWSLVVQLKMQELPAGFSAFFKVLSNLILVFFYLILGVGEVCISFCISWHLYTNRNP